MPQPLQARVEVYLVSYCNMGVGTANLVAKEMAYLTREYISEVIEEKMKLQKEEKMKCLELFE